MIDYQKYVDSIQPMTCVISVEILPDGSYGKIRIVTGNKSYVDSIENPEHMPKMLSQKFVPNSEYQTYLPKDLNFEDFCYRAAVLKQPLHTYVHPERFDFWFNIFMMPLQSEEKDIAYCSYTQEISHQADVTKMTQFSYETAADVLNTCIKLRGTDDFDNVIQEVISDIRDICDARHCCLLQIDFNIRRCKVLGSASEKEYRSSSVPQWSDDDHFELVRSWGDLISGSSCLIIKNENDMEMVKKALPKWHETLMKVGVKSLALFPLKARGQLLGYIWATNFAVENTLRIKETLELTTFFLASEIASYQMFDRLRILSTMDMLTGVYNRNEMNNRIDFLSEQREEGSPIGIVFADLNGLKQVNDVEGHLAGDLLLKNAAMLLQNIFIGNEIYRAGGDEFMVLIVDAVPQVLEYQVERIRKQSEAYRNVSFAIGFCCEKDSRNIRTALKIADQRMYEDKKRYYEQYPERRRS